MTMRLIAALEAMFEHHSQEHPEGASVMPSFPHHMWNEFVQAAQEADHTIVGDVAAEALRGLAQVKVGVADTMPQFAAGHWAELKAAVADAKGGDAMPADPPAPAPTPAPPAGAEAEVPPAE